MFPDFGAYHSRCILHGRQKVGRVLEFTTSVVCVLDVAVLVFIHRRGHGSSAVNWEGEAT